MLVVGNKHASDQDLAIKLESRKVNVCKSYYGDKVRGECNETGSPIHQWWKRTSH